GLELAHKVTGEEREQLRRKCINTITRINDGSIFGSISVEFATDGISNNSVRAAGQMRNKISNVQAALMEVEMEKIVVAKGYDGESEATGHLEFGEKFRLAFKGFTPVLALCSKH
uniref:hypothetical protein n=1 Tax=Pseudomonas viridiflava TaxID=33069 RepID=UPI0013CE6006